MNLQTHGQPDYKVACHGEAGRTRGRTSAVTVHGWINSTSEK